MKRTLGVVLFLLITHWGFAQTISGSNPVTAGTVTNYTYNPGIVYTSYSWYLSNGNGYVSAYSVAGTTYTCSITWTVSGTSTINFSGYGTVKATYNVTINCPTTLATPNANLTYSSGTTVCASVPVTYTTNPPTWSTWYWETSSSGTATTNATKNYSAASTGTYYLRAHCGTVWSSAQSTSALTVKPVPTVSAGTVNPICSNTSAGIVLTNNLGGTTNNWSVSQTSATGGASGSGVSAGSPPYNYSFSQTLAATSNVNGSVTYNVTPTLNGCSGTAVLNLTVTVKPLPTAAATSQNIFTGNATSIVITNPNSVPGTTYSWTATQTAGLSGAGSGSGSTTIAQTLTSTTSHDSATYSIKPTANSCDGSIISRVATVIPKPVISSTAGNIIMGAGATLDAGAGYASYAWANVASPGTILATTRTFSTSTARTYQVTVTKSGVQGSTISTFVVVDNFAGQNLNYVISNALLMPTSDTSRIKVLTADSLTQSIQYYDGHGRHMQSVMTQASPAKNDIAQQSVYDAYGRPNKKYLPFVAAETSGYFKSGVIDGSGNFAAAALNFYNNGLTDKIVDDTRPFSETIFETSDLNRPTKDYGPGSSWGPASNDKYVFHQYLVNKSTTETIIAWIVNSSGMPVRASANSGNYKDGQLTIHSTKDEQGNEVREYVDKSGHTLLKKVQATSSPALTDVNGWTQTYYIYDDFGLLRYVFQPELTKALVTSMGNPIQSDLDRFAFQYIYDVRNRMIQKRVPGGGWVYMVYDMRDRLVMTQDAVQRPNKEWLVTKYDVLNRPVITAKYVSSATWSQFQMDSLISKVTFCEYYIGASAAANHGYSLVVFPTTNLTFLTVTYYDKYNFISDLSMGTAFNYLNTEIAVDATNGIPAQDAAANTGVMGHPTGGKINVLGTTTYLKSAMYYDSKFRVIQSVVDNYKGATDRVTNVLDFTGRVLKTQTTHKTSTHGDLTVTRRFVYDHGSRVKKVFHSINGVNEKLLLQNTYNELGQLVDKGLYSTNGGTTLKQSVDYRYNIRGWLQSMNNSQLTSDGNVTNDETNDLFGMELAYNTAFTTGSTTSNTVQYNGNISAMKWSQNLALAPVKDVAYNYGYDPLNRITTASFFSNSGTWTNTTGQYNESGYTYDLNGNIKKLKRQGALGVLLDSLHYNYGTTLTNQLLDVKDNGGDQSKGFADGNPSGTDYVYDANGNMVTDKNKGLTATNAIQYNHLNLPTVVTKSTSEKIQYTYDAAGRKLRQQVYNAAGTLLKTTDYDGEFIYTYAGTDLTKDTLQFMNHEEGRVIMGKTFMTGGNPEYQYHLKDHLGNVRLTFTTKTTTQTFTAGFESANQTSEALKFTNYPTSTYINNVSTNAHTGTSSLYLNGGYSHGQIGVTKSFSVMPGDTVSMSAYAKYATPTSNPTDLTAFATTLLSAFGLTPPTGGETGTARAAINTYGASETTFLDGNSSNGSDPKIFVTILIFDRNYSYLDVAYARSSSSGSLLSATYRIKQPGYAYVYVSNEQTVQTDVYFDDVTVTYGPGLVQQMDDYYAGGAVFNSYTRENSVANKFKYQAKEYQDDLGLNLYDFEWRNYDPFILRTTTLDPHSSEYSHFSPYSWAANNPVSVIDPDGQDVVNIEGGVSITGADIGAFLSAFKNSSGGQGDDPCKGGDCDKKKKEGGSKEALVGAPALVGKELVKKVVTAGGGGILGFALKVLGLTASFVLSGPEAGRGSALINSLSKEQEERLHDLHNKHMAEGLDQSEKSEYEDLLEQKYPYGDPNEHAFEKMRQGNNTKKNEEVRSLYQELGIQNDKDAQDHIHDLITGKGYTRDKIKEVIQEYLNNRKK